MKKPSASREVSAGYFDLVKRHPLVSIRNEADLDAAQAIVDDLLTKNLDDGEDEYLDALSDLIMNYENEHHAIKQLTPHDLLAQMLKERGMSQADLVRTAGLAKASVSDLVSGKRPFTVPEMHAVARVFGLPASVFFPSKKGAG